MSRRERHEQADLAAKLADLAWFAGTGRPFRLRPSWPYEFPEWDAGAHQRFPIVLATCLPVYARFPLAPAAPLPDDQPFLAVLTGFLAERMNPECRHVEVNVGSVRAVAAMSGTGPADLVACMFCGRELARGAGADR